MVDAVASGREHHSITPRTQGSHVTRRADCFRPGMRLAPSLPTHLDGSPASFLRIPTSVEPGAPSSHAVRPLTSLHHGRHYPSGRRFVLSPRQHNQPPRLIPIPALGHSPICPVRAWTRYVACLPTPLVPEITPLLRSTTAPRSEPASTKTRVSQACSLDTSLPTAYAEAERPPLTKQGSPSTTYASTAPGPRTPFISTSSRLPRPSLRSPELSGTSSTSGSAHFLAAWRLRAVLLHVAFCIG